MEMTSFIIALFMFVLAIPFLFGKGARLIAGYNSASAKEKAQYDEKKLCHLVAVILILVGIVYFCHALHYISFGDCILIGISIIIVGCILANFLAKKKNI